MVRRVIGNLASRGDVQMTGWWEWESHRMHTEQCRGSTVGWRAASMIDVAMNLFIKFGTQTGDKRAQRGPERGGGGIVVTGEAARVETLSHCVAVSLSSPEVSRLRLIGGILKTTGRLGCYLYSLTVRRVHAVLVIWWPI